MCCRSTLGVLSPSVYVVLPHPRPSPSSPYILPTPPSAPLFNVLDFPHLLHHLSLPSPSLTMQTFQDAQICLSKLAKLPGGPSTALREILAWNKVVSQPSSTLRPSEALIFQHTYVPLFMVSGRPLGCLAPRAHLSAEQVLHFLLLPLCRSTWHLPLLSTASLPSKRTLLYRTTASFYLPHLINGTR